MVSLKRCRSLRCTRAKASCSPPLALDAINKVSSLVRIVVYFSRQVAAAAELLAMRKMPPVTAWAASGGHVDLVAQLHK
jgi:hypothetical protein